MKKDKSTIIAVVFLIILILLAVGITLIVKVLPRNQEEPNEVNTQEQISYNIEDYITVEALSYEEYSLYDEINVSKININNLDQKLIQDFINKQEELLKRVDNNYTLLKDVNFNNKVSTDISYEINKNILSIKFELIENIEELNYNNNYVITLNIDLKNNSKLSTTDMISLFQEDSSLIALNIYNNSIYNAESTETYEDAQTKEQTNMTNIENNKDIYIKRIEDKIDQIVKTYLQEGKLYITYSENEAKAVCYTIENNQKTTYITLE